MNNRQVETSREIRLWVTGIIGPVLMGAATIFATNPELAKDMLKGVKQRFKNFRNKKKETL